MASTLQELVGAEIRAELARQRMTQSALAEAMHRSEPYITRRMRGEVAWDMAEVERIAGILGVSVSKLLPAAPGHEASAGAA